jgi:protein SCO1/2
MIRTLLLTLVIAILSALPRPSPAAPTSSSDTDLGLEARPGAHLPLATSLQDEDGHTVSLGQFFAGKPLVIVFDYLRCQTICGLALANLAEAAAGLTVPPRVIAVSIDPRDTPADANAARARYKAPPDWHFLTGPADAVRPLADSAGFHYRYDAATDQYIHSVGYLIASADGTVSSYLTDLAVTPPQLQATLAGAAAGQVATPFRRLLLLCFGQGPAVGRYTAPIEITLVLLNLAAMLGAVAVFARRAWRREASTR